MSSTYDSAEWRGWLAGMIDGEGTVAIARQIGRKGYRRGIQMRSFVQIASCDRRMIDRAKELLQEVTGHRAFIHHIKRYNENHKPAWTVGIYSNSAMLALLTALRPYLIGKAEQADVIMSFCRRHLIIGRRRSDEVFALDELDYARCRILNHRGNHGGPDIDELERMIQTAPCST